LLGLFRAAIFCRRFPKKTQRYLSFNDHVALLGEVIDRELKSLNIILKISDSQVATAAEQSTDTTCPVIVINMKPAISTGYLCCANGTPSALENQHCSPFGMRNFMGSPEIMFALSLWFFVIFAHRFAPFKTLEEEKERNGPIETSLGRMFLGRRSTSPGTVKNVAAPMVWILFLGAIVPLFWHRSKLVERPSIWVQNGAKSFHLVWNAVISVS
jgi:hypothetical protein